jgi:hypothetical protein
MSRPYEPTWLDLDQEDAAVTLDGDDPTGDPNDAGFVAPEGYRGVTHRGTTVAETRAGETLDERVAEEEPDVLDEVEAELLAAESPNLDPDELAEDIDEPAPRAGRLVQDDEGAHADETAELVARDVGFDGAASSAEEAAIHVVPE